MTYLQTPLLLNLCRWIPRGMKVKISLKSTLFLQYHSRNHYVESIKNHGNQTISKQLPLRKRNYNNPMLSICKLLPTSVFILYKYHSDKPPIKTNPTTNQHFGPIAQFIIVLRFQIIALNISRFHQSTFGPPLRLFDSTTGDGDGVEVQLITWNTQK